MTATVLTSNPGFLADDELVASFCVRTNEFESMVEALNECAGNANTHQIVIGPRGSGKTSLLLRIATEIRRDKELSSRFFPVVYAEESYEISTAGEFWLECLFHLAEAAPRQKRGINLRDSFKDLRQIQDDKTLGERCLGVLQDFADSEGKRLVLIVENLNMLMADIGEKDTGWQLRHVLQTEPRILLLASATCRFDEIDRPDMALYDLFRALSLQPLDKIESATLWRAVSGQNRAPDTIQALRILTGGNPRLLTIMARFGSHLSFQGLMSDLRVLIDDYTEYFKNHLDALPSQERKVYLALLQLWKPSTAREVADRARLDTNKSSSHLKRLIDRGVVDVVGGTERRKLYYVTERLYNVYYLMRRSRGKNSNIESLIRFMEALYSSSELKDLAIRTVREAMSLNGEAKWMHQIIFDRLLDSPALSMHRNESSSLTSRIRPEEVDEVQTLLLRAHELSERGHQSDSIFWWDEAIRRSEKGNAPDALFAIATALHNKGTALYAMNRADEACEIWDEVVRRIGSSLSPAHIGAVTLALTKKAVSLMQQDRPTEAYEICKDVLRRAKKVTTSRLTHDIGQALAFTGAILRCLDRPDEALFTWDEVVQRFGEREEPVITKIVCDALYDKGVLLTTLNREEESLLAWNDVLKFIGTDGSDSQMPMLVKTLISKASTLQGLNKFVEALDVWNRILERFLSSDVPSIGDLVSNALAGKATTLAALIRPEQALTVWDEVLNRPTFSDDPSVEHPFSVALAHKSMLLEAMGRKAEGLAIRVNAIEHINERTEPARLRAYTDALLRIGAFLVDQERFAEALAFWNEVAERTGAFDSPVIRDAHCSVLVKKGFTLARMNRPEEALTVWDDIVRRFSASDTEAARESVSIALVTQGRILTDLNQPQAALKPLDDVIRRLGTTSFESPNRTLLAMALLNKARTLVDLSRLHEAIETYDEFSDRFGCGNGPDSIRQVGAALLSKSAVLMRLKRPTNALNALEEMIRLYRASDDAELQQAAKLAQLKVAELHFKKSRAEACIAMVDQLVESEDSASPQVKCQALLTRARAHLLHEDTEACMLDVVQALSILSDLGFPQTETLDALVWLAIELGLKPLHELIVASPATQALFPLTTALERELGSETRVAKEVEEVAEDIQATLQQRRNGKRS